MPFVRNYYDYNCKKRDSMVLISKFVSDLSALELPKRVCQGKIHTKFHSSSKPNPG
jgi:hypothetical protein